MLEASYRFYLPWKSVSMSGASYRESAPKVFQKNIQKGSQICRLSVTSERKLKLNL